MKRGIDNCEHPARCADAGRQGHHRQAKKSRPPPEGAASQLQIAESPPRFARAPNLPQLFSQAKLIPKRTPRLVFGLFHRHPSLCMLHGFCVRLAISTEEQKFQRSRDSCESITTDGRHPAATSNLACGASDKGPM